MADQQIVGPLDEVEVLAIKHEGQRIESEVTRLSTVLDGLKKSVQNTEMTIARLKEQRANILRTILQRRGINPGSRKIIEQSMPNGTIRILIG